jgi:hypothetical protein
MNLENYKHRKKTFTKCAIMFDVSWLLGQMNNVMPRIAAYFVIMCPYCAHMCILGLLTMLQKEVSFSSHKKAIFHF